jgi:chlorite dismutase
MTTQPRQFVKYTFLKVSPAWRGVPAEDREGDKRDLAGIFERFSERLMIRTYSTVGMRGDCDLLLWTVGDALEDIQALFSAINGSHMGSYLDTPHSFLAMTKRSIYVDKHHHAGQEGTRLRVKPTGSKYLFVYPFVKTRSWYLLAKDERQAMMNAHIEIGHRYPSVRINTAYSFGLDDQEFVVAFETDSPADFLDLVMELRETRASEYTLRDTPIFTCISMSAGEALDMLAADRP